MESGTELDGKPIGIILGESMKVRKGVIDIGSGRVDNGSIMDRMNGIIGIIPLGSRYKFIEASEQP